VRQLEVRGRDRVRVHLAEQLGVLGVHPAEKKRKKRKATREISG
jgi:hypothetical protein